MTQLALLGPATIEPDRHEGFHVSLFLGEPFDYSFPFRDVLNQRLSATGVLAQISLPPHTEKEDFIDGSLSWGDERYEVYFEHSLGYLDFHNASREPLVRLLKIALS